MLNSYFCVEALNKGILRKRKCAQCCSIKDKFFPIYMISSYRAFMQKLLMCHKNQAPHSESWRTRFIMLVAQRS